MFLLCYIGWGVCLLLDAGQGSMQGLVLHSPDVSSVVDLVL